MPGKFRLPRQKSLIAPMIRNPFIHDLRLSTLDKIQIAVGSVTIAPIRFLFLLLLLLLSWLIATIATMGMDTSKPMTGWRKFCKRILVIMGRTMYFFMGFHNIEIRGKPAPSSEAPLMTCAPHSTYFDIITIFVGEGLASGVSRKENSTIPLIGALTKSTQPVLVDREDPNSRRNTIEEIKKRAQSAGAWPQVIIFPEGTCTNRSCLINFKQGAFLPGMPVQPVALKYPNKLDTFTWTWQGPGGLKILWYTLCQFHNRLEVEFLPVYHPSEEEKNNAKLYAVNVRAKIAAVLNLPTTDHTFDDCMLMVAAGKSDMPMDAGLVEFQKLREKLGKVHFPGSLHEAPQSLKLEDMRQLLKKYSSIAGKEGGVIGIDDFAKHLNLPVTEPLKELFSMYDRDGSGRIDFREYVIGLSVVSQPANTEETLQMAFKMFDTEGNGKITEASLAAILRSAFNMETMDVSDLFKAVDTNGNGVITYDEFEAFSKAHPEYAGLFKTYQDLKREEELTLVEEEMENLDEEDSSNLEVLGSPEEGKKDA
ncbi:lysophosphatidylcholine acyltransferase 2-like isoform X1 [Branchiostoma floridae]|uniref:Lysophosphatidylcholine acyltransferase 2-like isoform X1 n=1 Tax=Branchiostoma floridae TaxID=7739 RepID=A0A9J7LA28_BRAFL|nr:lysophosphatidylcholine acyltransferase 2-like isoform X1 [Branchiostoma floridae]